MGNESGINIAQAKLHGLGFVTQHNSTAVVLSLLRGRPPLKIVYSMSAAAAAATEGIAVLRSTLIPGFYSFSPQWPYYPLVMALCG